MPERYQYDYLGPGWIRVLHLASVEPEVTFHLEKVSLDSNPTYNALSYTWGEPVFSRRLFIGDAFLDVTPSLHDCLQHLGGYVGKRIWIDALCINQVDDEEKSHQVQGMSRVYRQAAQVLIWLGTSADGSDEAMRGIAAYGKEASDAGILNLKLEHFSAWPDVGEDEELVRTRDKLLELMKKAADAEGDDSRVDDRLPRVAFANLTRRSYFTRVWVRQEITLAQNAAVICGRHTTTVEHCHALILFCGLLIPWEILEYQAGRMTRFPGPFSLEELMAAPSPRDLQITAVPSDAVGSALSSRRRYRNQGPEPLHKLLQQLYVRWSKDIPQCKDPRDKIWGMAGIVSDMDELGLEVNYKNGVEEVYESTARALLRQGHVDMLKWCRSEQINSPSWVPNWALPIQSSWSEDAATSLFKATGAKSQPSSQDDIVPGSISLQGVLVDTISEVGSVWRADADKEFDLSACEVMMKELIPLLEKSRYPEDKKMDALWRIPIGDKELPESSPYWIRATERSEKQFLALVSDEASSESTYSYKTCMGYNPMARPVASEQGYIGLGPSNAEPGDVIVLLFGGSTPFVLRPRADEQEGHLLVGEAYIYGCMDGELVENVDDVSTFDLW
ncbi:hypothetical protein ACJ41O_003287 [Fusarium nematophilum]